MREREKKVIAESEAELLCKANQSHKVEKAKTIQREKITESRWRRVGDTQAARH